MSQIKMISLLKFAPYHYRFVLEGGEKHEMDLIGITYNDIFIRLTDYHKYVGLKKGSKHALQKRNDEVRRVCNFLTYVMFEKQHQYKANSILEIPFEAVEDYLMIYSKTKNRFGDYASRQSVEKERNAVCSFMANINEMRNDKDKHFYVRKIMASKANSKNVIETKYTKPQWEYEIEAVYWGENKYDLVRDIPDQAIPIILRYIKLYEPELFLAVVLQISAGIREGEVVNLRRYDSKYYGGIKIKKEFGRFVSFEMDLRKEYLLRSDGKATGKIKRKRTQQVYSPFLEIVQYAYEEHMRLIGNDMVEEEGPLFVNKQKDSQTGKRMAISVRSYTDRILKVFEEYIIPEILKSDDVELQAFAMLIAENSFGLHAFRHWFTVQLVLNDEDLNSIASWRGDSSIESSKTYLMNKGKLMKKYKNANNKVAIEILTKIAKGEFDGI